MNSSQNSGKSLSTWSINVGGQIGMWRLISLVGDMKFECRPDTLLIQEVAASADSWITIHARLEFLGYRAYYVEPVGGKRRTGGVAIAVKSRYTSRLIFGDRWRFGQAIAIKIGDTLALSSYCTPGEDHPHQHAVWLHELWQTWSWHGKWIWSGDWNQTKGEADVVEVASIFGGHYHYVPENDDTTRWKSKRIIDFYVSNVAMGKTFTRQEVLFDHKIAESSFTAQVQLQKEKKPVTSPPFKPPSWSTFDQWAALRLRRGRLGSLMNGGKFFLSWSNLTFGLSRRRTLILLSLIISGHLWS